MALSRCDIEPLNYFDADDFMPILDFNTLPTISLLGGAVSDISEMVLREIGETIQHQRTAERRKLAKSKNIVQNVNVLKKTDAERGDDYGDDIHNAGGLPSARPDAAGAADHREIYGMLRKSHLKNHRKATYTSLLLSGKLMDHLAEIDRSARERVAQITSQTARTEGVNEAMKATDPMKWTGLMNNLKHSAEETVLTELIYS